MKRALLVFAIACKSQHEPPPPPAPQPPSVAPIDRVALLEGKLPEGDPNTELINAQCRICHSTEYLTQQRLAEAGWKKTIDKMRKFGAQLTDDQAASIVAFAVRYWNPALPPRKWQPVAPPPGALPLP